MRLKKGIWCLGAALLCTLPACAALLHSERAADESSDFEPPPSWSSAVTFRFSDARLHRNVNHHTRIEFHDGVRRRVVDAQDLAKEATGDERTPWYRLRGSSTTIKVVLEHPGGHETVAEYPLRIERDEFYYLSAYVYKHEPAPPHMVDPSRDPRSYPLHPFARAQPGDSLWILYHTNGRYCFNCPS